MVYLGEGGHSGAAAGMTDALLDGYGGWEPGYHIDLGPLKDAYILSYKGCKAFQIATLTLCEEDIKCQAGLSRTGDTRKHHQLITGDGEV
jgi:hypothetical protein